MKLRTVIIALNLILFLLPLVGFSGWSRPFLAAFFPAFFPAFLACRVASLSAAFSAFFVSFFVVLARAFAAAFAPLTLEFFAMAAIMAKFLARR